MNLNINNINPLPMRTWNYLGVNESDINAEIPNIAVLEGNIPEIINVEGVEVLSSLDVESSIEHMEGGMGTEAQRFVRENRNGGVYIHVKSGSKISDPVIISYKLNKENRAVVDDNIIIAEEGSEITVVISYESSDDFIGFHGSFTKVHALKNSVVNLVTVQVLSKNFIHFNDVAGVAEDRAKIHLIEAEMGANKVFSGAKINLKGYESESNIKSIYLGSGNQSIDINYISEHVGEKTKSDIITNGALLDNSQKIFRGTIDFKKGSHKAVGHEGEYSLLFSPNVRNRTAPLILCGEDDVEGQHAASTGRIDENKLFYLMSRGIDEGEAKKLIIEAAFEPIVSQITVDRLKEEISKAVKERFEKYE